MPAIDYILYLYQVLLQPIAPTYCFSPFRTANGDSFLLFSTSSCVASGHASCLGDIGSASSASSSTRSSTLSVLLATITSIVSSSSNSSISSARSSSLASTSTDSAATSYANGVRQRWHINCTVPDTASVNCAKSSLPVPPCSDQDNSPDLSAQSAPSLGKSATAIRPSRRSLR